MARRYVRPLVDRLSAYVPGEQPRERGLVKLNTNENPYPPSASVLRKVRRAVDGRLRLYPPPTAAPLREKLARLHRTRPDHVIIGNGSDELLALAVRAFVDPGRTVQWLSPGYSLYPVLAAAHGARGRAVPLGEDFSLPVRLPAAPLTFITTPNAPSGRAYRTRDLDAIARASRGVVLLDEAYADFAGENAMALALRRPNVLVARTFSKGSSLCYLRVGYLVGAAPLIAALDKIRDSYNVNGLAQVAALATLKDRASTKRNIRRIIRTRERLAGELAQLGFEVLPSSTNFLLVTPPRFPARSWLARLRKRKILVRWFDAPGLRDRLRITVGTDREVGVLLRAVKAILG